MSGIIVRDLTSHLLDLIETGNGDKKVRVSVIYDDYEHIQDLQNVHCFDGINWITLTGSDEEEEIINDLKRENEELKKENKHLRCTIESNSQDDYIDYLEKQNKRLSTENLSLKLTYAKCRDCKHANMYSPDYAFLVMNPKCELNIKAIHSESNACEDFEMIGRNSR